MNKEQKNSATPAIPVSVLSNVLATPFSIISRSEITENDFQKVHIKDGVDVITPRKVYELEVKSGDREHITISDADMILSVDKIKAARNGQALLQRVICRELFHLSQKLETIQNMGFSSVEDFATRMFGMSNKSKTVSQYIRIGKWFINDDYSVKDYLPQTIGVSAMLELLAPASNDKGEVNEETVAKWYLDGVLVDGMTIRRIRECLKKLTLPPATDNTASDNAASSNAASDNAASSNAASDNATSDNATSDNATSDNTPTDTIDNWSAEKAGNVIISYIDSIRIIVDKFVPDSPETAQALEQLLRVARRLVTE